jgi:hypothetical protein
LSLLRVVDCFGEDPRGFLRRVEPIEFSAATKSSRHCGFAV